VNVKTIIHTMYPGETELPTMSYMKKLRNDLTNQME